MLRLANKVSSNLIIYFAGNSAVTTEQCVYSTLRIIILSQMQFVWLGYAV